MSSHYVRTTVKNWVKGGTVPFYDTVNVEQNPTDPIWLTLDWGIPFRTVDTFCRETTEEGTIAFVFFGNAGIGDDDLLAAAETFMDAVMLKSDTSGRLVLLDQGAAFDFRQEEHFCIEFQVTYEYRS